ncbi:unnamed protein product, partial [Owenia fusiformis]
GTPIRRTSNSSPGSPLVEALNLDFVDPIQSLGKEVELDNSQLQLLATSCPTLNDQQLNVTSATQTDDLTNGNTLPPYGIYHRAQDWDLSNSSSASGVLDIEGSTEASPRRHRGDHSLKPKDYSLRSKDKSRRSHKRKLQRARYVECTDYQGNVIHRELSSERRSSFKTAIEKGQSQESSFSVSLDTYSPESSHHSGDITPDPKETFHCVSDPTIVDANPDTVDQSQAWQITNEDN